ncbi:MAG: helix-turn-helix domain-containing protein [Clostridiales bacterium]|nr:helix-turn-helix domain-containing protein [Clostridiales bacterium]
MQDAGHYYVLNHLVQFTGLTDRTLRNYLASGILQGEKINGTWHFTPEQMEAFLAHPAVRPSILARNHSLVYDFLLDMKKPCRQTCMILDIPNGNDKEIAEFFCCRINQSGDSSLHFSFHMHAPHSRVILTGSSSAVLALVNEYYAAHPQD